VGWGLSPLLPSPGPGVVSPLILSEKSDRGLGVPGKLSQAIPATVAIPFKDSDKRELTGGAWGLVRDDRVVMARGWLRQNLHPGKWPQALIRRALPKRSAADSGKYWPANFAGVENCREEGWRIES